MIWNRMKGRDSPLSHFPDSFPVQHRNRRKFVSSILVSQLPMTKTTQLIVAAVMLFLASCASVDTRAPVPVVTIVSARDVGSEVEVTARYAKVTAGKQEINVGLGYTQSADYSTTHLPYMIL